MKNNKIFIIPLIYIFIMAVGMSIMHYGFGEVYGNSGMMKIIFWVEIILCLFTVYSIKKYSTWKDSGFGKLDKLGFLWIVPNFIAMGIFIGIACHRFTGTIDPKLITPIVFTGLTTILVGFSEEAMFRGIMLNWSLKKYGPIRAVLISSLGFSLLHSINVLGGEPSGQVISQMISTFFFGLFAALIALKLKNIIPLMIIHFLWDFSLFATFTLEKNIPVKTIDFLGFEKGYELFATVLLFILLIVTHFKNKKKS